ADQFAPVEQSSITLDHIQHWLRSRVTGLWRSLSHWSTWAGFMALALIPAGLFLFLLYSKLKVGRFLAYALTQQYGWNHHLSNPLLLVLQALQHPPNASPWEWNFYLLNIISIIAFACLLVPVFRKF